MKNINILIIISLLHLCFCFTACLDDDYAPYLDKENTDCNYCFEQEPEFVEAEMIFNIKPRISNVQYSIYRGYAFKSELYAEGLADTNHVFINVKPNLFYTVVAQYTVDNKIIYVINDFKVKVEYCKDCCSDPCYYVHEAKCNLELLKSF